MNNKVVLAIGAVLIVVGVLRPDLSSLIPSNGGNDTPVVNVPEVVVEAPTEPSLKEVADELVKILKAGGEDRRVDGLNLAKLYSDIASLISLDLDNEVVKTTSEIREVNGVAGSLMNLKLKGKYPEFAQTAKKLVVAAIGDDIAVLNDETRSKAVDAFNALAWACYEGAK
jgi:hypothetical protein